MEAVIRKGNCPSYCAHALVDKLAWALEDVRSMRGPARQKIARKFKALEEYRRRMAE